MPALVFSAPQIIAALQLVTQIAQAGGPAWASIKGVLAAHGYDSDTTELDKLIEDAIRRKVIAEAESQLGVVK